MRKLLLLLGCLGIVSLSAIGQATGDYRSFATGAWNNANNWERFNGTIWVNPAPATPTSADGIITIMAGHTINIPSGSSITADQIEYDNTNPGSTGILVVDAGGTLVVNNGAGNDVRLLNDFTTVALLQVSGTLQLNTGATMVDDDYGNLFIGPGPVSNATYSILSGGVHIHTTGATVDVIPAGDWQSGSTCQVNATSGTVPSIAGSIAFHHFIWNGSGQTALLSLNAGLTTINGDFNISSTNGNILQISNVTAYTLTIGQDFLIQGNSRVQLATTASPVVINAGRDFTVSSTNATANGIAFNATGSTTINVTRDFSKSGASQIGMVLGTTGTGIVNLSGNFSITAGSITRNSTVSSGSAAINFNGASVRTFTNSGTISNAINFTISNGKTLNFGTSPVTGTGTFTLSGGGSLGVGSADGITTGTSIGSIRTSGVRTYAVSSNIIYNGSIAQDMGNEWGVGGALNSVGVNLGINNSSGGGVTNNNGGSTSVVGILTLTNGSLNIGAANTLDIQGNFVATSGTIGGDASSSLSFSASGTSSGNLTFKSGTEDLRNLTIARSGTIVLGSNLKIASNGTLAFTSSGDLRINGQTLQVDGNITQSGAGGISSLNTASNLLIGGSGALSALPFCSSCGTMEFNNVTFDRGSLATYTWGSAARVNGTLDLKQGSLTHTSGMTMVSGATFSRSAGTSFLTSAPNTTGSYNVAYVGNLSPTTGLELPSSASALNNLTVGGNITLDKTITINGNLNLNSGTLSASTFNVTMAGATFSANGGGFSSASTGVVTFSRAGTTTLSGSTIDGTQFGNLTINSGATVSAPNANLNVSGTWSNSGTFTANSGTVTFNGSSQSLNPNAQPFNNVVFAGSGTKTLAGQLDVTGTLTINSTLDVGSNNPINVAGSWTNSGTFTANGGTVTFNGAAQSINSAGQPFFNLTLANSGTKTLTAAIDINGALAINSGVTFDVGVSSFQVNLAGNLTNNGTFAPVNGTIIFDGTTVIGGSSSTNFNNVTITGAVTGSSGTSLVSGNWLQSSGTFLANGGTLNFNGSTQSITPGGQTFNTVTISGSNTKTLLGAGVISGVLTFSAGTFDSNGQTLNLQGNLVSNSGSVLTASAITFSGTTTISGGTTPTFGGITITGTLTPTSSFNVNGNLANNGTLNAGSGTVTFGGTTAISGSSTSSFNNIIISGTLTAPSGTMNVAGNWTNNGTFGANNGTIVFNGTTAISGSSATTLANLNITSTLTAPGSGVLGVSGNFTNNGTFNNNNGAVTFSGSGSQSISGSSTTFNNMNGNNSSGTNVNTTVRMNGVLTLNASGVFDADGAGSGVFIVSSSSVSAGGRIAALPTPANFSGQVTVERFIHSQSGGDYRFLSMPVTSGHVGMWRSSIFVTGNFLDPNTNGDNANINDNSFASVFTFNSTTQLYEAVGTGVSTASTSVNSRIGYAAYNFNDGSNTASYRGPIETGSIPIAISTTNNNFNLVPNPYPSPIDWDNVTKTNVNNAMWVRTANNIFSSYVLGIPVNAPFGGWTGEVATGQAFWTQSNAGGNTLTLNESDKTSNSFQFLRVTTPENLVRIQLKSATQQDEMVVHFVDNATDNIDSKFDAVKRRNGNYVSALGQNNYLNISSYLNSPSVDFAINSMAMLADGQDSKVVKLKVIDVTPGNYSLTFSELSSMSLGYKIYLKDDFLNQEHLVTDGFVYEFSVTSNPLSYGDLRFSLRFLSEQIITALGDELNKETVAYPNPVNDILHIKLSSTAEADLQSIVLLDVLGNSIISSEKNQQLLQPGVRSIDMTGFASGIYILNVSSGNDVKSIKVIKR